MKQLKFNLFPGGKTKALTMSYDDGRNDDRRLVQIFNKNGIKGTFHLNSGMLDCEGYIRSDEVASLYQGHEVSSHGVHHYDLSTIPAAVVVSEIQDDRKALEKLVGYPVRGMSYPFGTYNPEVLDVLSALGIEYSRTTLTTKRFWVDADFLKWKGTCHHDENLMEIAHKFLECYTGWSYSLMYVWGHSFEFERNGNWNLIEEFSALMGGKADIWYATNIEIVDYFHAVKGLRFTADQEMALNPSALDVWVSVDGKPVIIPSGQCVKL